jgi:glutaredoxin 3
MAERLLKQRGVEAIEKVLIDREPGKREEMMTRTGRRTVPQIYIDDTHVGGFDDLSALDRQGGLCRCWRPDPDGGGHARRSRSRDESDNAAHGEFAIGVMYHMRFQSDTHFRVRQLYVKSIDLC